MTYELDANGNIHARLGTDGPVDPGRFREVMTDALQQHQDAGIALDLSAASPVDAPTLAVVVQSWLAVSDRGRELTVSIEDPADRAMLECLGFDEFYTIADAA